MAKIFFIADTHFGEERIRKYENRPFENIAEMDRKLICRWNDKVSPEDTELFSEILAQTDMRQKYFHS